MKEKGNMVKIVVLVPRTILDSMLREKAKKGLSISTQARLAIMKYAVNTDRDSSGHFIKTKGV